MKKLFSMLTAICILLSATVTVSAAADPDAPYCNPDYIFYDCAKVIYDTLYDFDNYEENTETEDPNDCLVCVDITGCGVTSGNLQSFIDSVFRQMTEIFFIDGHSIGVSSSASGITALYMNTIFDLETTKKAVEKVDSVVNDIIQQASDIPTIQEKALFVHNYLTLNNRYNSDILAGVPSTSVPYTVFNIYGALVDHNAVCQGYALAFNHIMRRMGCRADFVMSTALNHGWSLIEIDGYWYHVDVTWDDPTYDKCGNLDYENFLLSDAGIKATGHDSFDSFSQANATTTDYKIGDKYDTLYLHDKSKTKNNVVYNDGLWYFVRINGKGKYDICTTEDIFTTSENLQYTVVKSISSMWYAQSGGFYPTISPSIFKYDDRLFYSVADAVYVCNFDMSNESVVLKPEKPNNYTNLYGILIDNDVLYYQMLDTPNCTQNESLSSYQLKKADILFATNSDLYISDGVIFGVMGEITARDLMFNVINSKNVYFGEDIQGNGSCLVKNGDKLYVYGDGDTVSCGYTVIISGDVNRDGKVNTYDIIRLKKLLNGASASSEDMMYFDVDLNGELNESDLDLLVSLVTE